MKKLLLTSLLALLVVTGCQTASAEALMEDNKAVVEGVALVSQFPKSSGDYWANLP